MKKQLKEEDLSRPDTDHTLDMNDFRRPREDGTDDNRGRRPLPGSGVVVGSGAGAGGGGNPEDIDDDSAGGSGRHLSPGKAGHR